MSIFNNSHDLKPLTYADTQLLADTEKSIIGVNVVPADVPFPCQVCLWSDQPTGSICEGDPIQTQVVQQRVEQLGWSTPVARICVNFSSNRNS